MAPVGAGPSGKTDASPLLDVNQRRRGGGGGGDAGGARGGLTEVKLGMEKLGIVDNEEDNILPTSSTFR